MVVGILFIFSCADLLQELNKGQNDKETKKVEEKIKKERLDILQTLLFSYQEAFNKSCVGKVMPVLFEQKGRHKGQLIGRTPYMQNLHIETESANINKIINVEVTEATTNSLSGKEI